MGKNEGPEATLIRLDADAQQTCEGFPSGRGRFVDHPWSQPHVAPQLRKYVGPDQYAGPALGTVIANHTLRTFRDEATLEKWSTALVYVDLSKALDMACRKMAWSVEMSVE